MSAKSRTLPETAAAMMSLSFEDVSGFDASSVALLVLLLKDLVEDSSTVKRDEDTESMPISDEIGSIKEGFSFGATLLAFADDVV
jgi:hypothetical protein